MLTQFGDRSFVLAQWCHWKLPWNQGRITKTTLRQTDTERSHLIGKFAEEEGRLKSFKKALHIIIRGVAPLLMDAEDPSTIYGKKNKSPLLIGLGDITIWSAQMPRLRFVRPTNIWKPWQRVKSSSADKEFKITTEMSSAPHGWTRSSWYR